MPLDRTIDVSVPHTLPQATAWERVLRWLTDSKSQEAEHANTKERGSIVPGITNFDHRNHRVYLELDAYGKIVKAKIDVTPNVVELHSEPIDGSWVEMVLIKGSILFSESRICSQLVEALKP